MQEIQFITFDAAGTLLVPHPSVGWIYTDTMRRHGVEAEPEVIEKAFWSAFASKQDTSREVISNPRIYWKRIVSGALADFCPSRKLELIFDELWERFGRGESWRLLDKVRPTLETLKGQERRMAVLSNNDSRLHKVLEDLGIGSFFEHVFVSSELGCGKPDPKVFRSVEEVTGLRSNAFLHIGDDPVRDADAARKAGWEAILLTKESGPGLRAREISQLPDLLETLAA